MCPEYDTDLQIRMKPPHITSITIWMCPHVHCFVEEWFLWCSRAGGARSD